MELKRANLRSTTSIAIVLIVPFMELKQTTKNSIPKTTCCLNRTFYGIETPSQLLK